MKRYLPLIASLILSTAPRTAEACGGLFCDGPMPMPVDQRGEDILFVLDGSTVEVHIRIEYTGEAARFAWIVPLQGIPEVSVGSEPLFAELLETVGANWRTTTQYDCEEDNPNGTTTSITTMGFAPSSDFGGPDGPTVVYSETVGAFDVVVLQGGTAMEVIDFLTANDYAQDPESEPILQEYLDEGFLFAAVKLTDNAGVDAIHPLVFRFPGDEPCVPLRLTRIAAEEDMGVRTYFLGTQRWVPSNYRHVELNPLAFNWELFGPELFFDLLALAIDEAGGRGFVTDYAGPSDVIDTSDIYREFWDENALIGLSPYEVVWTLIDWGLFYHPLMAALLTEYLPPPEDELPEYFWTNLDRYPIPPEWDPDAFLAALAERIIEPAMHAADLIETWPKLTRLSTIMSPHEMTLDPIFHTNDSLPDVDRADVRTTEQVLCGGDRLYHVEVEGEDTPVCVPEYESYPDWVDMPKSLWSGQVPMVGGPQIIDDNREEIEAAYQQYQSGVECAAGDGDSGDGDGDPGDGDSTSDSANDDDGSTGNLPADGMSSDSSCACAAERGAAPVGMALGVLVLGLIGPWRRRK
jgi:MYXO-CTERM domain-containing protein